MLNQEGKNDQMKSTREKIAAEVVHRHKVDVIDGEDHTPPLDHPLPVYTPILRVIELVYH